MKSMSCPYRPVLSGLVSLMLACSLSAGFGKDEPAEAIPFGAEGGEKATDHSEGAGEDGAVDQAAVDSMFDEDPAEGPMGLEEIEAAEGAEPTNMQEYAIGEPMADDVTAICDIPVQISAVLGRSTMQVSQLLKLGRSSLMQH